jgi:hypothetical protein
MNDNELYNNLLNKAASSAGLKPEEIEYAMDVIINHESAGTFDPYIEQTGGGPGRGLFQYEIMGGDGSGAGRTAMNYLHRVLGGQAGYGSGRDPVNFPTWMKEFFPKETQSGTPTEFRQPVGEVDVTKLNVIQQKILFLGDKIGDGSISKLGDKSLASWWSDHHHKGNELVRKVSFIKDQTMYDVNKVYDQGVSLVSKFFNDEYTEDKNKLNKIIGE